MKPWPVCRSGNRIEIESFSQRAYYYGRSLTIPVRGVVTAAGTPAGRWTLGRVRARDGFRAGAAVGAPREGGLRSLRRARGLARQSPRHKVVLKTGAMICRTGSSPRIHEKRCSNPGSSIEPVRLPVQYMPQRGPIPVHFRGIWLHRLPERRRAQSRLNLAPSIGYGDRI